MGCNGMRIQQLRVLMELCQGRTLLETAEKLQLTQPTVSFHLRKLEESLGLELMRKSARKLRPTEDALDLLPIVRRIVALSAELESRAAERPVLGGGRLRLGAGYTPATYLLPAAFVLFREQHPRIQLQLTVKKAETILNMLRDYELDAAVIALPDISEQGLVIQPLVEDPLQLIISPEHRLARQTTVQLEDLSGELLLLHEPGSTSRMLTDEWLIQSGARFNRSMELGAIETMKEAVKCNLGIAVLPERSVSRETIAGELVQRPLPHYRNRRYISLVYRSDELLSTNARLFAKFITAYY